MGIGQVVIRGWRRYPRRVCAVDGHERGAGTCKTQRRTPAQVWGPPLFYGVIEFYRSIGITGPGRTGPGPGIIMSRGGRGAGQISQYIGTCHPGGAGLIMHGGIRGGRGAGMIRSDGSGFTMIGARESDSVSLACAGAAANSSPVAASAARMRRDFVFIWRPVNAEEKGEGLAAGCSTASSIVSRVTQHISPGRYYGYLIGMMHLR